MTRAKAVTTWLSRLVAVVATLAAAGWVLGVEPLINVGPGRATMQLSTAACLLALAVLQLRPAARWNIVLSGAVLVIALLTLAGYATGAELALERLFVDGNVTAQRYPGRMSVSAALALLALSLADLTLRRGARRTAQVLTGVALVLSGVAVLGYLYGVEALYQVGPYSTIALVTALALGLLCLAFLARVEGGLLPWILNGQDAGALLLRRLLPVVFLVLPLLALARLRAERLGIYDARFGLALNTTVAVAVLATITLRAAVVLRRTDDQRLDASEALHRLNAELEVRVRDRSEALERERTRVALLQDRNRIARDLHDRVIQRIFASGLKLSSMPAARARDTAELVSDVVTDLDMSIRELRETIFRLELGSVSDHGAAISETAVRLEQILGFPPAITLLGDLTRLPPDVADHLLAVTHEALTNVAKHAGATAVELTLTIGDDEARLVIADDGRGLTDGGRRSGMNNIESRARELGGEARWERATPQGTVLTFCVPLRGPAG